tara:strand:+ start:1266 stop:1796 length:531 start_codon:yes stop_codon:yes gene_type:complete
MFKFINKKNDKEQLLYNKIVFLSRNKLFYTKMHLGDTFQNRIMLIFLHISFIFAKSKNVKKNDICRIFFQRLFDLMFNKIDQNMREIGYGDITVSKNMKHLIKNFYNILLDCEKYSLKSLNDKSLFFSNYLKVENDEKDIKNKDLIDYFDKYYAFCLDLTLDSVLKGNLNFNYKQT